MNVGVLALQGDFREHCVVLESLGANVSEVRLPEQLDGLDGLVIPGGESTTIGRLMRLYELDEAFSRFEGALFGTCAGMIVLARDSSDGVDGQLHLGEIDVTVRRNGYGRQVASFESPVELDDGTHVPGVFIRAPRIVEHGTNVELLAHLDGEPVLVREGRALAAAFHPELADDRRIHSLFLEIAEENGGPSLRAAPRRRRGREAPCLGTADGRQSNARRALPMPSAGPCSRSWRGRSLLPRAREARIRVQISLCRTPSRRRATASMPKDNIERAIARGSGADADGAAYETVTYEGYGPAGVAILVEALTDNRNRTAADIRHMFAKHDGNLGSTGSVAWQFERRGVVLIDEAGVDADDLMLIAADAGADDIDLEGATYQVSVEPESFAPVKVALEAGGVTVESADLTMIPKNVVVVEDEGTARKLLRLMDALDDNEDVQGAYANFDIPETLLELVVA